MGTLIRSVDCKELLRMFQSHAENHELTCSGELEPGMALPEEPRGCVVFDVRPPDDFSRSTIVNPAGTDCSLNIDPKYITPQMWGYVLERKIRQGTQDKFQRELFYRRNTKFVDTIVFMDWGSKEEDLDEKHILVALKTILRAKDPGQSPPEHVMLEGGFEAWARAFPDLTTSADVRIPEDLAPEVLPQPVEVPDYLLDPPGRLPVVLTPSPSPDQRLRRDETVEYLLQCLEGIEKLYQEQKTVVIECVKRVKEIVSFYKDGEEPDSSLMDAAKNCWEKLEVAEKTITVEENRLKRIDDTNVRWFFKDIKRRDELKKNIAVLKKQVERQKRTLEKTLKEFKPNGISLLSYQPDHPRGASENIPPASSDFRERFLRRGPLIDSSFFQSSETHVPMEVDAQPPSPPHRGRRPGPPPPQTPVRAPVSPQVSAPIHRESLNEVKGKTTPGIVGLINPDNLCYANSIFQCLSHVSQIKTFFTMDMEGNVGKHTRSFSSFMKKVWSGDWKRLLLVPLKETIAEDNKDFDNTRQQDTQEFLGVLLDYLHEELKDQNNSSIIWQTFNFKIHSTIKCTRCPASNPQSNTERFLFVSLPLEGIENLKESIDAMMMEEIQWKCPTPECGEVPAEKTQYFESLPPVLIIVITRFKKREQAGVMILDRNGAPVNYPMDLELSVGEGGENGAVNYRLKGVACHIQMGERLTGGHYFSIVKHLENGRWYNFNDDKVKVIHEDAVLTERKSAYVLFYAQDQ